MVDIAGVGSFSAADYSAGLQAALAAADLAQKTNQQMVELAFRSALEVNRAVEERRRLGLEKRRVEAALPGIQAQTALSQESLKLIQEQRKSKERFGEFIKSQAPPSLPPGVAGPPAPRATTGQLLEQFSQQHPLEALDLTQARQETLRLTELEARIQGLQETLEQHRELREPTKRTAEAGARKTEAEAGVIERREKILAQGAGEGLVGGLSSQFTEEDLQRAGMTRDGLDQGIKDAVVAIAEEGKTPTPGAVRQQVLQNLGNIAALREKIQLLERQDVAKGEEAAPAVKQAIDDILLSTAETGVGDIKIENVEEAVSRSAYNKLINAIGGVERLLERKKFNKETVKNAINEALTPSLRKRAGERYKIKNGKAVGVKERFQVFGRISPLPKEIDQFNELVEKYGIVLPDSE